MVRFLILVALTFMAVAASDPPADPPFHKELKQAASDYKKWGRVDDEARWAPELCRRPLPAKTYVSKSDDDKTHGQKLYSLFVKERNPYLKLSETKSAPVGQIIVKQSWVPEEVKGEEAEEISKQWHLHTTRWVRESTHGMQFGNDHFVPYAMKDQKVFKGAKQADLFIMLKVDPKTADTDEGWIYGTVTADGKAVTSAGKIASCMKCHMDAKTDRLFGLAGADQK